MLIKRNHRFVLSILVLICLCSASSASTKDLKKEVLTKQNVVLEGVFAQGGMLRGKLLGPTKVFLNDESVRVTSDGRFILGFGRDAAENQKLSLVDSDGQRHELEILLTQRKYKTQSIKGVPQKTVTPSKDKLERIKRETAQVKLARKTNSDLNYFLGEFIVPIEATITGVYGSQRIYNGVPKRPHFGVDYAAPHGALVTAPASGIVTLVHDDMYYSGGTLIVDHGYGMSSTFIHLSEILVEEGQKIELGQEIAKVGSGGRSTGPHLDWRVNWYDVRLDPQLILLLAEQ